MAFPANVRFHNGVGEADGVFYFQCARRPHKRLKRTFHDPEVLSRFVLEHKKEHERRAFVTGERTYTVNRTSQRPVDAPSPSKVGAAKELLVCSDLLMKGWEVFRGVAPDGCDLAARRGAEVMFVEVKTTGSAGRPPVADASRFTHMALVLPSGEIRYLTREEYRQVFKKCTRGHLMTRYSTFTDERGILSCVRCATDVAAATTVANEKMIERGLLTRKKLREFSE